MVVVPAILAVAEGRLPPAAVHVSLIGNVARVVQPQSAGCAFTFLRGRHKVHASAAAAARGDECEPPRDKRRGWRRWNRQPTDTLLKARAAGCAVCTVEFELIARYEGAERRKDRNAVAPYIGPGVAQPQRARRGLTVHLAFHVDHAGAEAAARCDEDVPTRDKRRGWWRRRRRRQGRWRRGRWRRGRRWWRRQRHWRGRRW